MPGRGVAFGRPFARLTLLDAATTTPEPSAESGELKDGGFRCDGLRGFRRG